MEKTSRRKFLAAGLGCIGAALAGGVLYPIYKYLAPRRTGGNMEKVSFPESDLTADGAKFFDFSGSTGVVVRKKGATWSPSPQSAPISAASSSGKRKTGLSLPVPWRTLHRRRYRSFRAAAAPPAEACLHPGQRYHHGRLIPPPASPLRGENRVPSPSGGGMGGGRRQSVKGITA